MHSLLLRQLKKMGIEDPKVLPNKEQWSILLEMVSRAYAAADEDRIRLERSLEVSSREMQERMQQITMLAFHDKLTGLPNRALFGDRVEAAMEKVERSGLGIAVLHLDLDNFKLSNDSMGHEAGDELLKQVAERIRQSVRPGDTVARLSGDEFSILLEDLADLRDAELIASNILKSFHHPMNVRGTKTFSTASIGVAYVGDKNMVVKDLLKAADTAMYHAKAQGKATYAVYRSEMNCQVTDRLELENHLRLALTNNELFVVYQPLVDLQTNSVTGSEALVRWNHPVRGLISPAHFIPIAEETGLIQSIGYWVLETACKQLKAWHRQFQSDKLCISVNLSGKQLQSSDVVERVQQVLETTKLPPANLKLEITETILMAGKSDAIAKMRELKSLGIKLALDDFGTGYSSLSTLGEFPIDTLKIDRAFVSRLESEAQARAIVETIISLAKSMKMDVTSEGVETEFQRDFIAQLGGHTGQGYLFSKPVPAQEFEEKFLGPRGFWEGNLAA